MSESFDPYHRWLGIPPKHQPANHYRLLGLELFEDNAEVISDAAERQMAHVRRCQLGAHAATSQKILNELAAAMVCLLDPQKKGRYDHELRRKAAADENAALHSAPLVNPPVQPLAASSQNPLGPTPTSASLGLRLNQQNAVRSPTAKPTLIVRIDQLLGEMSGDRHGPLHNALRVAAILLPAILLIAILLGAYSYLNAPRKIVNADIPANVPPQVEPTRPTTPDVSRQNADDTPPDDSSSNPKLVAPFDAATAKAAQEAWAKKLKTEVVVTNSIGMELVLIPPGEFMMGSLDSDALANADEKPQHRVQITNPFFLGKCEVTQAEWTRIMGTEPWKGQPFTRHGPTYPATCVSWNEAQLFCVKLTEQERRDGRLAADQSYVLPTEAQWEYACRAGSDMLYGFGNDSLRLDTFAWLKDNTRDVNQEFAHEVKQKKANQFGLFDMHGNVYEWCDDWLNRNFYATAAATNPDSVNTESGSHRVFRGGSWQDPALGCRTAIRNGLAPEFLSNNLGFRVARGRSDLTQQSANVTPPDDRSSIPKLVAPFDAAMAKAAQEAWAKKLKAELTVTNSIGMKLVLIPPGEFMMGSLDSDAFAENDEKPAHRVKITKPFYLGTCEVSQVEWKRNMGTEPWKDETNTRSGPTYPATFVSWDDAKAFCGKLTDQERRDGRLTADQSYSLPTEAQWEFACRAGSDTIYSFGNDSSQLGEYAWFTDNRTGDFAHEVKQKKPNRFGLYDMHGNVWEWCEDCIGANFYETAAATKPDPVNAETGAGRVFRGGGWSFSALNCRSADRAWDTPQRRDYGLGFRVARGLSDQASK